MKFVKSISLAGMLLLLLILPSFISGSGKHSSNPISGNPVTDNSAKKNTKKIVVSESMNLYDTLRLKRVGLSRSAFEYAWKGYQQLSENGKIAKGNILAICDFSQSSRRKRLYIIDVLQKKVLINTYVAHGRNSGAEYARSFSNSPESHKSSLGFYVTKQTYWGDHGLALRIEGQEDGINDNASDRNIVIHGSDYVGSQFIKHNPFNGRSFGCPAIPAKQTTEVINTIKNGSCLFIYHPTKKYLTSSKILNS
jgi:hypothetical protein